MVIKYIEIETKSNPKRKLNKSKVSFEKRGVKTNAVIL